MSRVSALARLEAMESMAAVPKTEYRHHHLAANPLVIVPLAMAGEAGAPLAAIVGQSRRAPILLVVTQPRDRVQRFTFAAELSAIVMDYIDSCRRSRHGSSSRGQDSRSHYTNAPQILVPNTGGIKFLRFLGRACRFRETRGDYPVPEGVPELGRWLTFFTDRADQAGSAMLMAVTDLLSEHWATGQSDLEDHNLASQMAWIAPPDGQAVAQAMLDAENPIICPPAGPSTSPEFDHIFLAPALQHNDAARASGDHAALAAATTELRDLINDQIKPTWRMMWDATALLQGVPEAPRTAARFNGDCVAFTAFSEYQESDSARPQPTKDRATRAAQRLNHHERALENFEADIAFDDRFIFADRRSAGEAFAGDVESVQADRVVMSAKNKRVLRPLVTIRTLDPVRLPDGTTLISPSMPAGHKAVIISTEQDGEESVLTVEVTGGMGTPSKPKPDAVPTLDGRVAYLPDPGWRRAPVFPNSEHTPWTHSFDVTTEAGTGPGDATAEEWGDDN